MLLPLLILQNGQEDEEYNSDIVKQLSKEMMKLNFSNLSDEHHHGIKKTYLPKDLESCTHVWLRVDRAHRPLEAPYCCSYKIVSYHQKHLVIELGNGDSQSVSIDRAKPAIHSKDKSEKTKRLKQNRLLNHLVFSKNSLIKAIRCFV